MNKIRIQCEITSMVHCMAGSDSKAETKVRAPFVPVNIKTQAMNRTRAQSVAKTET